MLFSGDVIKDIEKGYNVNSGDTNIFGMKPYFKKNIWKDYKNENSKILYLNRLYK